MRLTLHICPPYCQRCVYVSWRTGRRHILWSIVWIRTINTVRFFISRKDRAEIRKYDFYPTWF